MAVRRRIAERIATPLKRAGLETPVLEQIPHKAEVISAFYYQAVEPSGGRQVAELLRIPAFAHGKAYGETAGFWYRVTYPKPIQNPSVVCVGEGRTTSIRKKLAEKIPEIEIPPIEIPTIDIIIPRYKWVILTEADFIDRLTVPIDPFREALGDWGVFNWMRELIVVAVSAFSRVLAEVYGRVMYWGYTQGSGRIQTAMNEVLDAMYEQFDKIRNGINTTITRTNERIATFRTETNERIETIRNRVNEVTSDIIPSLYDAWGLPSIMALTSIHIRNVTSTGFEFQSLGKTTCHWVAIGTRT